MDFRLRPWVSYIYIYIYIYMCVCVCVCVCVCANITNKVFSGGFYLKLNDLSTLNIAVFTLNYYQGN